MGLSSWKTQPGSLLQCLHVSWDKIIIFLIFFFPYSLQDLFALSPAQHVQTHCKLCNVPSCSSALHAPVHVAASLWSAVLESLQEGLHISVT